MSQIDPIDQQAVIDQLLAENRLLRKALHDAPPRELQIAAELNVLMDELTRLGPKVAARVLTFVNNRYYKSSGTVYEHDLRDRRPPTPAPVAIEPPKPVPIPCPLCEKSDFKTRAGMIGHVWKAHGKRMSEIAA